jgi:hypothetical protein
MMGSDLPLPKLEYLVECPESALQAMELGALDLSAQCLKRAKSEWEQSVAHREAAGVYRWLIANRDEMIDLARRIADGKQGVLRFPEAAQLAARKRA